MDPSLNPQTQPQDLKTQVKETTNKFVTDHYEGFLRRSVNLALTILKFLKNSILSMINMALGKD